MGTYEDQLDEPQLIDLSTLPAQPWKNGGGVTTEIAVHPPGASMDTFSWRVSQAKIDRDGPFSAFPHVTRWITLLSGNGFELLLPGGRTLLVNRPFVPHRFDGGIATQCRLLDGPCTDLNVMAHRSLSIAISIDAPGPDAPPSGHALRRPGGMLIRLAADRLMRIMVAP